MFLRPLVLSDPLFRATRDRAHLLAARRVVEESAVQMDEETHASVLANFRLNREIVEAADG